MDISQGPYHRLAVRRADAADAADAARLSGPRRTVARGGAVLLEVIIALFLLVLTAAFVLDGLSGAMAGVARARLDADATDLAVTVFSEVQLGLIEKTDGGPNPFEISDYEDWTWQVKFTQPQDMTDFPQLVQCEVIVRNEVNGHTHRAMQWLWDDPNAATLAALQAELSQDAQDATGGDAAGGDAAGALQGALQGAAQGGNLGGLPGDLGGGNPGGGNQNGGNPGGGRQFGGRQGGGR